MKGSTQVWEGSSPTALSSNRKKFDSLSEAANRSDCRVIFLGSKTFWRTGRALDVLVVEHCTLGCLEVITFDPKAHRESSSRQYLSSAQLAGKMDQEEFQQIMYEIEKDLQLDRYSSDQRQLTQQLRRSFFARYVTARLNLRPALHGSNGEFDVELISMYNDSIVDTISRRLDVICEKPHDLRPYQHPPWTLQGRSNQDVTQQAHSLVKGIPSLLNSSPQHQENQTHSIFKQEADHKRGSGPWMKTVRDGSVDDLHVLENTGFEDELMSGKHSKNVGPHTIDSKQITTRQQGVDVNAPASVAVCINDYEVSKTNRYSNKQLKEQRLERMREKEIAGKAKHGRPLQGAWGGNGSVLPRTKQHEDRKQGLPRIEDDLIVNDADSVNSAREQYDRNESHGSSSISSNSRSGDELSTASYEEGSLEDELYVTAESYHSLSNGRDAAPGHTHAAGAGTHIRIGGNRKCSKQHVNHLPGLKMVAKVGSFKYSDDPEFRYAVDLINKHDTNNPTASSNHSRFAAVALEDERQVLNSGGDSVLAVNAETKIGLSRTSVLPPRNVHLEHLSPVPQIHHNQPITGKKDLVHALEHSGVHNATIKLAAIDLEGSQEGSALQLSNIGTEEKLASKFAHLDTLDKQQLNHLEDLMQGETSKPHHAHQTLSSLITAVQANPIDPHGHHRHPPHRDDGTSPISPIHHASENRHHPLHNREHRINDGHTSSPDKDFHSKKKDQTDIACAVAPHNSPLPALRSASKPAIPPIDVSSLQNTALNTDSNPPSPREPSNSVDTTKQHNHGAECLKKTSLSPMHRNRTTPRSNQHGDDVEHNYKISPPKKNHQHSSNRHATEDYEVQSVGSITPSHSRRNSDVSDGEANIHGGHHYSGLEKHGQDSGISSLQPKRHTQQSSVRHDGRPPVSSPPLSPVSTPNHLRSGSRSPARGKTSNPTHDVPNKSSNWATSAGPGFGSNSRAHHGEGGLSGWVQAKVVD